MEDSFDITEETDIDSLENIILKYSTKSTNSFGYDLLQQAIIVDNKVVAAYILMKNIYAPTYHPNCNEYLHLACKLKRESMIKVILESRPTDFKYKARVCYPNICFHTKEGSRELQTGVSPLDIIVMSNQTSCLLAFVYSLREKEIQASNPVAFLCNIDHPRALDMVLKAGVFQKDLKLAFREALQRKRYRCLDSLLTAGYKDLLIRGLNPFHVLYQYSSGYNLHNRRHATTMCLLRHGADVSAHRPAGSYPLYSLLDLIIKDACTYGEEYLSEAVTRELMDCLKLIVKQGVKFDVDEKFISLSRLNESEDIAFGRDLFTSVFHVISSNCCAATTINLAASEVIKNTVEFLLQQKQKCKIHPFHVTGVIQLLGGSLHSKSICRNIESVIYGLLWEGVDVNQPIQLDYGVRSSFLLMYSINQYVEALCKNTSDKPECYLPLAFNQCPVIRWLINLMSYNSICTSIQINYRLLSTYNGHFTEQLIRYITRPPLLRLKTLSARVVWFAISRRRDSLVYLPIPKHMKTSFVDIIIKEI